MVDAGRPCVPEPELCNGLDDDCDGVPDNGFDFNSDPNNCGTCGTSCTYPHAFGTCVMKTCTQIACQPGWADLDASTPGCEARCAANGTERCDGRDNDCDGLVDESDPLVGTACGPDAGVCNGNVWSCTGGALSCGGTPPAAEVCDGLDNDCNGTVDDGYDKQNDPRTCGSCAPCSLAHATPGCSTGHCTIARCDQGWIDANSDAGDGCEATCPFRGAEVCNGLDDDCDGLVDNADPDLVVPPNRCPTAGACAGSNWTCNGSSGWRCTFPSPNVELTSSGALVAEETRCDGFDNDCDGFVDEVFPAKNSVCAEDGTYGTTRRVGVCRGTGQLVCNPGKTGLRCNITVAGATATNETCNGRDDDCDGWVDEGFDNGGFTGVRDAVVGPLTVNGQSVVMYRYEASRPDSTDQAPGYRQDRACSVSGRLPWTDLDQTAAKAACASAGMRLCAVTRDVNGNVTSDEWGRFCAGASGLVYPYGNTYSATACNGSDYDPVPGGVNEDIRIPTGTLATCVSSDLSRDQSGNVWEWVDDPRTVGGQLVGTLRGGASDSPALGLTCSNDLRTEAPAFYSSQAGFRCCARSCTAGQTDCSGTCVNLATSNSNCGACGTVCGAGRACSNGYCCPTGSRACGDQCIATAVACP